MENVPALLQKRTFAAVTSPAMPYVDHTVPDLLGKFYTQQILFY
ncbi:hypothetical protein [Pontibacter sp. 172403-2]|nr:hypothetical protein [Pontibacter sp. 172403-2]